MQATLHARPHRIRELFDPVVRACVSNWDVVAGALLTRARRELLVTKDAALAEILDEARSGAPWTKRGSTLYPIRVELALPPHLARLFSIVNAWATSYPGLRIEMLHPVDERSERALAAVLDARGRRPKPWRRLRSAPLTARG